MCVRVCTLNQVRDSCSNARNSRFPECNPARAKAFFFYRPHFVDPKQLRHTFRSERDNMLGDLARNLIDERKEEKLLHPVSVCFPGSGGKMQ